MPARSRRAREEPPTWSMGAVVRSTGISEHTLRAWERRHGAVAPLRTQGGTRRYRESDVERLRLLHAAVEGGHAISAIAQLPAAELRRLAQASEGATEPGLAPLLAAVRALDADAGERLLGAKLAALGPRRFVEQVASPLLQEVGAHWAGGRLSIAAEHLASALLRNLLAGALRARAAAQPGPVLLFATPSGERHEFGVLFAAVVAAEAGAAVTFLGADLPAAEIAAAAERIGARAVAVGVVSLAPAEARRELRELRRKLAGECAVWVGGSIAADLELPPGTEAVDDLDALERKVALLRA